MVSDEIRDEQAGSGTHTASDSQPGRQAQDQCRSRGLSARAHFPTIRPASLLRLGSTRTGALAASTAEPAPCAVQRYACGSIATTRPHRSRVEERRAMALGAPTEAIPAARALLSIRAWGFNLRERRTVCGRLGFQLVRAVIAGARLRGPRHQPEEADAKGRDTREAMAAVIKLAFEAAGWVTGRATGIAGPLPQRRVHHAAD